MFSYYGSKSRIVHLYPPPKYGKIIEPFAGSARYALRYWDRDVLLVDKYEVIVRIWKWLQQCSERDITGLPALKTGEDLRKCGLSEEEMLFLGMCCGIASITPRFTVSAFAGEQNGRYNRFGRIAKQLHKIRHWKIQHGSYEDIPDEVATWFIDPPYQVGGQAYKESKIDYNRLADWSMNRSGQVIICENMQADWLPLLPLSIMRGANMKHQTEGMWTNMPTSYNTQQQSLFQ